MSRRPLLPEAVEVTGWLTPQVTFSDGVCLRFRHAAPIWVKPPAPPAGYSPGVPMVQGQPASPSNRYVVEARRSLARRALQKFLPARAKAGYAHAIDNP